MSTLSNPAITKLFIYLAGALFLIYTLKALYPTLRGKMGEFRVRQQLNRLHRNEYKIINDLFIAANGKTSQIDHLVISKKGLIVIETKGYYGLITGGEGSIKWTQHMGRNKYYFMNPIHQNYAHQKALESVLPNMKLVFLPVVVFADTATLKVETKSPVIHISQIYKHINSIDSEDIYSGKQIVEIAEKLESLNIKDRGERRKHIQNIKSNVKAEKKSEQEGICPKCGGKLVERSGRYGKFTGCSNYPKCKFTLK